MKYRYTMKLNYYIAIKVYFTLKCILHDMQWRVLCNNASAGKNL